MIKKLLLILLISIGAKAAPRGLDKETKQLYNQHMKERQGQHGK